MKEELCFGAGLLFVLQFHMKQKEIFLLDKAAVFFDLLVFELEKILRHAEKLLAHQSLLVQHHHGRNP